MEMTDRAKGLSDSQVKQAFKDGSILPYILLAEMNNRKAARDDAMASEASAQPSNVAEDLGLGLGGLGETAFLAEGGVVGYAPGGRVGEREYEDFELHPTREPGRTLASLIVKYPDAPVDKLKAALIKHTGMEENVVRQAITQFHGYTSMRELTNAFPPDERSFLERSRENFTKAEFKTEEERKTADETWNKLFGGGVYTPEQAEKPIAPEGITNALGNDTGYFSGRGGEDTFGVGSWTEGKPDAVRESTGYFSGAGEDTFNLGSWTKGKPDAVRESTGYFSGAGGEGTSRRKTKDDVYPPRTRKDPLEVRKEEREWLQTLYPAGKRAAKGIWDALPDIPQSTKRGLENLYALGSEEGRDRAVERASNKPWVQDLKRHVGDPGAEWLKEKGWAGDKVFADIPIPDMFRGVSDAGVPTPRPGEKELRNDRLKSIPELAHLVPSEEPIVPTDEGSSGIAEELHAHKNQLDKSKAAALAATPEKASGLQALLDPTTPEGAALLAGLRLVEEGGKGKDPLTAAGTAGKDVIDAAGKRQMATRKLNIEEKAMQAAAVTAAARAKTAKAWTDRNTHAALTLDVQSALAMWKEDSTSMATLYTALAKANSNDKPAFLKYIGDLNRRMEMVWNHMKGLGIGVKGPYQGMASNMGGGSGSSDGFTVYEAGDA
jgi:hypothetical protein